MSDLASLLRFPCDQSKRPLIGAWQRNAARDDYSDWPLVGVPTGEANGFDVLDIDLAGSGWWDLHRAELPATQTHVTRSGGAHLLFRQADGLRCTSPSSHATISAMSAVPALLAAPTTLCLAPAALRVAWPRVSWNGATGTCRQRARGEGRVWAWLTSQSASAKGRPSIRSRNIRGKINP